MKSRLFILLLFLATCLLEISGQAQTITPYATSGPERIQVPIRITPYLVYLNDSGRETAAVPLDGFGDRLPIFKNRNNNFEMRYAIELMDNQIRAASSKTKKLKINYSRKGNKQKKTLKMKPENGYKDELEFENKISGGVEIQIEFLNLEDYELNGVNDYTLRKNLITIEGATNLLRTSQSNLEDQKKYFQGNLEILTAFEALIPHRSELSVDDRAAMDEYLSKAEAGFVSCFEKMLPGGASLDLVKEVFLFFKENEISGRKIAKEFREETEMRIAGLDDAFYEENFTGLSEEEKYAQKDKLGVKFSEYEASFKIRGYSPKHRKDIADILAAIRPPITPVNPCHLIQGRISHSKSIRSLNELLAECKAKDCGNTCNQIIQKIRGIKCQELLTRAKKEDEIEQKRSLLQELINTAACKNLVQEAEELLADIESIELGSVSEPIKEKSDSGTEYLVYTITFLSGKALSVLEIDGRDSSSMAELDFEMEWLEVDRSLRVKLRYRDEPFPVKVISGTTQEELEITLSKDPFIAKIEEEGDNILTATLTNGVGPFYARFFNRRNGSSFSLRLRGDEFLNEIDLDQLAESYVGKYELEILDNSGRSGLETPKIVAIQRPFRIAGWMIASPVLLLLITFLFYRNLNFSRD